MDLNPAQYDAVHTRSGPLLVLAGAGTGKTRVVTYRIAELIRRRTRPERILAVAFTNKAADEMQARAAALLGKRLQRRPEISTFHSLCVRVLRRNVKRLGYPENFAIYDRGDQEGAARSALREIKVAEGSLRPGDLLYFIGKWKSASVRPEQAAARAETDKEHLAAAAYRRYQNALKAAGAMDFDDLLLCTEELFDKHPAVRRAEAGRFDHLLVDEYQDTNASQYRIVKALAAGHRNLCVVGDDDQSIYGWRGADVAHILRFKTDWPEAKVVRLEINYRSTREILEWSNRLIAFNKLRHPKRLQATRRGEPPRILQLENELKESQAVVGEIARRIAEKKRRPRDFAILCRTNEQPRAFEMELRRANVPYILIGGTSFYDRKEVRDVLAYLKTLANPADEASLLRIVNVPPRGIGQTAVKRLMEGAVRSGKPLGQVLASAGNIAALSDAAKKGIADFHALLERYRRLLNARSARLAAIIKSLIDEVGYRDELARLYPDANDRDVRWASVEELVNAAAASESKNSPGKQGSTHAALISFLRETALTGADADRDKESKLRRNAVALMTLHAAKGLEFREVYMVGMEEGTLPHHRSIGLNNDGPAIDEERRLCYVGATRAQRRLTLTLSLNRRKWGKPRPTICSRFLYELTGKADNPNYLAIRQGRANAKRKKRNG
ncbi:MAG: UvrD-helicase domain-containing protein [Pirellulales bacterium]|nr:UvrD-helicase domain-containing protein [Pirellulales bacterium]